MDQELASVIIPNWNGLEHLKICLAALRCQSYRPFETLVVDNASQDGSLAFVREQYPEVRLIQLERNRYYTGAANEGIRQAKGDALVLLNNDTEPEPDWLTELMRALREHPEAGMATSKILLFDQRHILHSAGDLYRRNGIPGNRGVWEEDQGQYDGSIWVFGACGGAAAYRRQLLEEIGLFDEDLGMYCEDVDLAFRAQLMGYRCVFAPRARVYHRLSATGGGALASYFCGRNFISVVVKNMPGPLLRRHFGSILGAQLGYLAQSLGHFREEAARARLRGQLAGLLQLPRTLAKRRRIQVQRRISLEQLQAILS